MPAAKRVKNMVFVLVPEMRAFGGRERPDAGYREAIRAAQCACRVAHMLNFQPISPLLYYMTFLSFGELSMELSSLSQQWLRRCDRIWLQFPDDESEDLDGIAFDILDENQRLSTRRPVFLLHPTGDVNIGYVPVNTTREEVQDLLNSNLTAGLARRCM